MLLYISIFLLFLQASIQQCTAPNIYYLAANTTCYQQCPWKPPVKYYANPDGNTCVTACSGSYYAFDGNQTCTTSCPSSPNLTYYDIPNRRCVNVCPEKYYGYLGTVVANNQTCVQSCPGGQYADDITRTCVLSCPTNTFYFNGSPPICTSRCPSNYYGYPIDKTCYVGGSCPDSPVAYYADDTNNLCVTTCSNNTFSDASGRCLIECVTGFADNTTWKCVTNCPVNYYRSNVTKTCLLTCTQGYFMDRKTSNCTQSCSSGTYGDSATKFCQAQCTIPTFGDASVGLCVNICSIGLYADNFTQTCVTATNCYSFTVGDPTTRKCVNPTKCPSIPYFYANSFAKICTLICPYPYWGDKSTKSCVSICPWNPGTYLTWANSDTRQCVTKCPEFPMLFADNYSKYCVANCPQKSISVPFDTYADQISQTCVRVCPNGFISQKPQNICVSTCSNHPTVLYYYSLNQSCIDTCPTYYFADESRQLCVTVCPSSPSYFGLSTNKSCVVDCPNNLFADQTTRLCVSFCPQTSFQYADNSTNKCVDICPINPEYFGQQQTNGTRTCVQFCSVGLYADPITRTCVLACNINKGYYGEDTTPLRSCITQCPEGQFADNISKRCVPKCPDNPVKYFGNPNTKKCTLNCPQFSYGNSITNKCGPPSSCQSDFFADDLTNRCVSICPFTDSTFGQTTSRRCLKSCPQGKFADNTTRRCSSSCNTTARLLKDPSTNRCVQQCPSTPNLYNNPFTMACDYNCTNDYYAYDTLRTCVANCPSTPPFFADLATKRCVAKCPNQSYAYTNNTFRGCVSYCPSSHLGTLYADNSTWSCVPLCPQTKDLYNFRHPSDITIRKCVLTCPIVQTTTMVQGAPVILATYYFAQNITQSCVTLCPLRNLTYGDIFTSKCQKRCTRNQFRDNSTVRCVYSCSNGFFADNTTWNCVRRCPVGLFAQTTNRTCSKFCPSGSYADNTTRFCRSLCNNSLALWSDNTTWSCVLRCPSIPDLYADPSTDKCQFSCSDGLFADKMTRRCVTALKCTNNSIGDPLLYRCVQRCPIQVPSFWKQQTNTCQIKCDQGFYADNSTMKCVQQCPSNPDYYSYDHSTLGGICVLFCPVSNFKYLPDRSCRTGCPAPYYFKDSTTMSCVRNCPDHFYAQSIGQICVSNCSVNEKFGLENVCYDDCSGTFNTSYNGSYNADLTTYQCVQVCPFTYFAQDNQCKEVCDVGFADPITIICQPVCSPGYYAQLPSHLCVMDCAPQYKFQDEQTCVSSCPQSDNHTTNLYKDNNSFTCQNQCLPGWYSDNNTGYCQQTCSELLFADNSTGRCVQTCPQNPDYYGYNNVCYFVCPLAGWYAENTTRQCQQICPNNSFADDFNQRCMDVCSKKQYSFSSDQTNNICVDLCPQGFYSSDETKSCVEVCPEGTYGQNTTNKCFKTCPTGTYADDFWNLCVQDCDFDRSQFADWSSNKCVKQCPKVPSLFAQNSSRSCVTACQQGWFALNTTRICTETCPQPYYADSSVGYCVKKCTLGVNHYADNQTRTCSPTCPNYTDPTTNQTVITYADDTLQECVFTCTFVPSFYGDNSTNKCVDQCPQNSYGDNDTRLCLDVCFFGSDVGVGRTPKYTYADPNSYFCVRDCPQYWYADNRTVSCVKNCSLGTYSDNSTWRCVFMCPSNPLSYGDRSSRRCVYDCKKGLFGNQVGRTCDTTCPIAPFYYYRDNQRNRCVLNCTTGFYAQQLSQACVKQCSIGYFESKDDHICQKCPSSCLVCYASLNCTSCLPNLYLYQGTCISSCPTFPILHYANTLASTCVVECPDPYFGFNGTGKCQINCPQTYYNDISDNTCKDCPKGCIYCNANNCSSCLTGYIYVSNYGSCSKICNSTNIYYVNGNCASSCPAGTFLLFDLVNCQKCSTTCATCSVSGNNCTKCASKFWYNYNCVDQCPSTYYVDVNNSCVECKSNPGACQLPPLNFTLQTFTKDYSLYAYVIFNRAVNLTDDQFSRIAIISTSKGPVKSNQYFISVHNSTTYKLRFLDSASLNQMSLFLGFPPGSIMDGNGNGLAQSSASTQVETLVTIPTDIKASSQTAKGKTNVISWILIVVLFLMMIKCSYPLIVLIDLLQMLHMHIYIVIEPLPYMWMSVTSALSNVEFTFLPKLHQQVDLTNTNPYYLFQTDITFLGNFQPLVFLGGIYLAMFAIFWLLNNKKINRCRLFRKTVHKVYKYRMKYSFINEIFYYTQLYVVFFALFQFGSNKSILSSASNLAMSVICLIFYVAWMVFLAYIGSHYRKRLENMPTRYHFLTLQKSKFPMDIPFRFFHKFLFALCLTISFSSVQITLLIVLNLIYLLYTLFYRPSQDKITNNINILVSAGLIAYQIVLSAYTISDKTSDQQEMMSYALLSITAILVGVVMIWIAYRFIKYFKKQWLGIEPEKQEQNKQILKSKSNKKVQKYKSISKQGSQRNMNVSELNFKDQQDQQQQVSIKDEDLMNQFAYHMIPKKNQALLKDQNRILSKINTGLKLAPIKKKPEKIIISIDEGQLIDQTRPNQNNRNFKNQRLISRDSKRMAHLRINNEDNQSMVELEHIQLGSMGNRTAQNFHKKKAQNNKVIWDNLQVENSEDQQDF